MIIKRKPLPLTARRSGWVGCNIDLHQVPESGKVFLVKNKQVIPRHDVTRQFQKTVFLREQSIESRGWTLDIMNCVNKLPEHFTLAQVYIFIDTLQAQYPNNKNVSAKIRQQLQILRDKGLIEFLGRGNYRKLY